MFNLVITIMFSFLCGSIPTAYLITKELYGIDIRKGSSCCNFRHILG
ncbi:hypothetical protein HGI79_00805 [Clostridium sp. DJ247]|nr:hypothetical protein [Clostridium sp. DJ247]